MANFFKSVLRMGEHSVTQPFKAVKQTFQGHPDDAFKDLFHDASRTGQDVAHSVGIRGWVGDHPMQSVGALVATIFGGWAAWGAYGAGAAGGTAAGATGAAGGAGAGSGVAAGTVIGQTVPATPGMIAAANGGGAAIGAGANATSAAYALTSTPSLQVLAGAGYGTGGSFATTLGGEAQIGNTGLSGGGWMEKAKDFYNVYNKVNQAKNMLNQQPQDQKWGGVAFQNNPSYQPARDSRSEATPKSEAIPTTTTELLNGIDINTNFNNGPFTQAGTFGGFN